ncbi:MAG TPA: PRC-barrel domain-containing protein [Acidimicrobiia bacterium]|nr:PRC-barrel domain-containing protein [Acidimicrobiia bacterium]HTC82390.1 PRC-barrel domain-containing protein [Acidimicrobiia bacterium]
MSSIDQGLVGKTLMGGDGHKIGRIDAIYVNSSTGDPEWVAIKLGGLIADKLGFAPVAKVSTKGETAVTEFDKKWVKQAPTTRSEGVLSPAENDALYTYYGIERAQKEPSGSHDASLPIHH